MKLSQQQKAILYGIVLGDGYLQKTGKQNARLRIEHSAKPHLKSYINWKYSMLRNLFQVRPIEISRIHPTTKNRNNTFRLQSHSSPYLGKLRNAFYPKGTKCFPENLDLFLSSKRTLAIWYMDDGYYDRHDKSAHLYLPQYNQKDLKRCVDVLTRIHGVTPKWYCRADRKACQFNFTGDQMRKWFRIIDPYLIPSMKYKSPTTPLTP